MSEEIKDKNLNDLQANRNVGNENISEEASKCSTDDSVQPEAELSTEELIQKVAESDAELAKFKDRYLRLMADCDNMRKRQIKELEERTKRANENLLQSLIPVFDHLEMAIMAIPQKAEGEPADAFEDGVKMIAKQFQTALEQSGATLIDAESGKPFDVSVHEALQMIPDEKIPVNHVIQQFRKGWLLGGKVIRPAQVIVSSGNAAKES